MTVFVLTKMVKTSDPYLRHIFENKNLLLNKKKYVFKTNYKL